MRSFLVNLDTGEVLGPAPLGRRLRVGSIKRAVSPAAVGRLWEDQPFAVVGSERDASLPAGHRATGETASYDGEAGLVVVASTSEAVPIAEQQLAKAAAIRAEGARRLNEITAAYTPEERDTWAQQAREADAYGVSADAADAPMLAAMATARGITLAAMVGRVDAARTAFTAAAGAVLGAQQKLETDVWAIDPEDAGAQAALDGLDPADAGNWP